MNIRKIIFISIILILYFISCNKNKSIETLEIEPNDNFEYAQFIDNDTIINGNFNNGVDIDYFKIHPTNGFIMNAILSVRNNLKFKIIDNTKTNIIFDIDTENILNYNGEIKIEDFIFYDDEYYLVLESEVEGKYKLKFSFNSKINFNKESEDNNSFNTADTIEYPNQKVYGYFIQNTNIYNNIQNNIKENLSKTNLIDIDMYKIINSTDINSEILIRTHYSDDIEILIFDKNKNFIKKSLNKIEINFNSKEEYFIALAYYNNKYIVDKYTIYYKFN